MIHSKIPFTVDDWVHLFNCLSASFKDDLQRNKKSYLQLMQEVESNRYVREEV